MQHIVMFHKGNRKKLGKKVLTVILSALVAAMTASTASADTLIDEESVPSAELVLETAGTSFHEDALCTEPDETVETLTGEDYAASETHPKGDDGEYDESAPFDAEFTFEESDQELLMDADTASPVTSGQVIQGTDGMPTLNIILADATLDQIKGGSKDIKYQGNSVFMSGAGSVPSQTNVEIKGRGNSTWDCPKKPFQIKFDKKQELFGQGKAKKWILLANYLDPSQLRNDIGLSLASKNKIPGALPQGQFVEVYFNGVYEGLYYLTRKVEVGTVPLKDDKGIIVEFDHIRAPDEPSGYSTGGSRFGTKETVIDSDDMSEQRAVFDSFMQSYNAFEKAVMNKDWKTASRYADMESFAKYFLLADFTGGQDMFGSSCYMHKDGDDDVIHAGPMWDFDLAYGESVILITPESQNPYRTWAYMDVRECPDSREVIKKWAPLYEYLMNVPEFRELVRSVYWGSVRETMVDVSESVGQRSSRVSAARKRDLAKWHSGTSGGSEAAVVEKYMKDRILYFDFLYQEVAPLSGYYDMSGAYNEETVRASRTSDGYYVLSNKNGDVLEVSGENRENKADGAGARWSSYNGSDAQKWLPLVNGALISKETGFVLTQKQGGAYSISRVELSGERPSAAQTVIFKKIKIDIASAVQSTAYIVTKAENAKPPGIRTHGAALKEGRDYTITRDISTGDVRYTVTGMGEYSGKAEIIIKIAHNDGFDPSAFYRVSSKLDRTKALTVSSGSLVSRGNVQLESFSGMLEDYWFFEAQADGTYCIRNARSGMALDVEGGMSKNGTNVQQYTPNGTNAQKYIIDKRSAGAYEIIGVKSQKAIDVKGGKKAENTNVQIYTPNNTTAQRWYIEAAGKRPDITGTYKLVSCAGKGDKAASVAGTSMNDRANVFLWDAETSASAKWVLGKNNDLNNTWSIRSAYSGKALDVEGLGTAARTNVQQYTFSKGNTAQQWVLMKDDANGTYTIFSICSGLALDVNGGSGQNRANIQIYTPNGTAAQRWKLLPAA